MKRLQTIFLFFILSGCSQIELHNSEVYTIVEESSSYPGGLHAWYSYIKEEMNYPRQAIRMGIEGRVFVQFVVEKDGYLSNIHVVERIGAGCDEEAQRIVQNSGKWNPAKMGGQPVRHQLILPILFKLPD